MLPRLYLRTLPLRRASLLHLRPFLPSLAQQICSRRNYAAQPQSQPAEGVLEKKPIDPPVAPKKKGNLSKDLLRIFRLAKPEYGPLVGALLCLLGTSTVSMSLPYFIGKIIDTAKDDEDADEAEKEEKAKEDKKILGFSQSQFYGGLVAIFMTGSALNFGRIYLLRTVGEKMVARLRSRLFAKILCQDSYFFDVGPQKQGMKTGDLISRLSSDTQIISKSLSGNVSDGARSIISGIAGLSMMWWVSWKLTLCMSLLFPPLIVMSTVYGRQIKQLSRTIQESLGGMAKVSEEKFNGLRTIQSFAQQRPVVSEYNKEVRAVYQKSMLEGRLSGVYYSINGFLGNATLIGLLIIGTRLITAGEITIGDLSSFMMYAVYTGSSVFGLGNFYTELMKGIGAADRVFELIDLKPKITTSVGKKVDNLHGDVVLRNITFAYPSRPESPIFRNISLTIKKGEHVCLVGPSGSGKSSISQLLLRFYDPNSGVCLVNGHDIKDLNLNFYRGKIGYVQQEPLLFSGSIRDNITFGKPNSTSERIEEATRLSNAHNFIASFPQGLDTLVGPSSSGSAQLSGGQRQRIALARTLIKDPEILILDEATSALDSRSEEIVMKNLSELSHQRQTTIILIAHRLSTIENSERIIVFNNRGEIVEDGAFDVLIQNQNSQLNRLLKSDLFTEEI